MKRQNIYCMERVNSLQTRLCRKHLAERLRRMAKSAAMVKCKVCKNTVRKGREYCGAHASPECFQSNPSYQTQAENDCDSCSFRNECF